MWNRLNYFGRETLVSLRRNILMTLAGILTVAVSLTLFGGIMLLSAWVDHGTEQIKGGVTLEVFMNVEATAQQIQGVRDSLEDDRQVKSFRFLSKSDAYDEFTRIFRRDPDLVSTITADDLPASFRIAPIRAELTETVGQEYQTLQGVEDVQTPGKALKGILDATSKVRSIFIAISLILLTSSLFLIVNTIRLATFARRREIEVMKLVGASNWFVRIPFMAEGMVQGLAGAGLSVGLVVALKTFGFDKWFTDPESFLSRFYVTNGDVVLVSIYVLVLGAGIGIVGATIGLRRFLRT